MGKAAVGLKAAPEWKPAPANAPDMQGLIVSAYPRLTSATFLMLSFASASDKPPVDAKGWLRDVSARITDATGEKNPSVNLVLSAAGLQTIGLGDDVLATFSRPFREGMAQKDRARFLGDVDDQAPDKWDWRDAEVHAMLMLYADSDTALQTVAAAERQKLVTFHVLELGSLPQTIYPDVHGVRREHFGFADGFSQPNLVDGTKVPVEQRGLHDIAAGEVVLGQINTYGDPAPGPVVPSTLDAKRNLPSHRTLTGFNDLGRNGTYLVARHLQQKVAAFWLGMDAAAATMVNDGGRATTADWLAQKVIGRSLDGDLLTPGGTHSRTDPASPDNNLTFFDSDRDGFGCPVGSHIRRANPREGLAPKESAREELVQAVNRHRIVRRGRTYGERAANPRVDDGIDRGLIFVCLNSEIDRQFEFVQHTWLLNPMFGGLFNESDPLLGPLGPFTVPASPVRQKPTLERFVKVRGGGYFFMPSLSAIRFLGGL